jgi:hypothetical protein
MATPDSIPEFRPGHKLKASELQNVAELAKAAYGIVAPDMIRTATGVMVRRRASSSSSHPHWGTLGAALAYNNTTGVTVTLIEGGTIDNVLPPEGMTEGTFASGATVKIEQIPNADGVLTWYVTLCNSCPT